MKEIGIFEVKKGGTCGVVYVPRKVIQKRVKIFLVEESDEKSLIDSRITRLENEIRDLEFKKDSLQMLKKTRKIRAGIK